MKNSQSLTVSADILKSAGLTLEGLSRHLSVLKSFLGTRLERVVPSHINDVLTLNWLVNLSGCLEKLSHCKGFDIHISRYNSKSDIGSAYDVAVLATYLLDKVDSVELEPLIEKEQHRQDILVSYKGGQVSLECKTIATKKYDYKKEHDRMSSILLHYINVPHQIDIKYKASLLETEMHELGKAIKERLRQVTADGYIIHNEKIEVGVQRRLTSYKGPLRFILLGISEDLRVVVWDENTDTGYQLLGEMEHMMDIGMIDGYTSEMKSKWPLPQVESQLVIHVNKVTDFKRAPHSDVEE